MTPRAALRAIASALVIAAALTGCLIRGLTGPRYTGTCDGACEHYVACKADHHEADRQRCRAECPTVLADRDAAIAFESLSCTDAVEFIDGDGRYTAER